jgi:5'-3' exonuclease
MTDLKGLMGDASDEIPGVDGHRRKNAMALISRFGALTISSDLDKFRH